MTKKILVADDSITIQKVVFLTLADEEYEVTTVGDGTAAIDAIKLGKPDLVVADVVMPGKNGYDVCRYVKNEEGLEGVPVLLLAGAFDGIDEDAAADAGADAHIIKPFESEELKSKIKELLSAAAEAPIEETPTPEETATEPTEPTEAAAETEPESLTDTIRRAMEKEAVQRPQAAADTIEAKDAIEEAAKDVDEITIEGETLTQRIRRAMAIEAAERAAKAKADQAEEGLGEEAAAEEPSAPAISAEEAGEAEEQTAGEAKWNADDFVSDQLQQESPAPAEGEVEGEEFEDPFADAFTELATEEEPSSIEEAAPVIPTPIEAPQIVPPLDITPAPEKEQEEKISKEVTDEEFRGLNLSTPDTAGTESVEEEEEAPLGDLGAEDIYGYDATIEPPVSDASTPPAELDSTVEIGELEGFASLSEEKAASTEQEEEPAVEVSPEDTTVEDLPVPEAEAEAATQVEPPTADAALQAAVAELISKERIEEIVREVAKKMIEEVAWEVVPELTEQFIRSEIITKLKEAMGKIN